MSDKPSDRRNLIDPDSFWNDATEEKHSDGQDSPMQTPGASIPQKERPQVPQRRVQLPQTTQTQRQQRRSQVRQGPQSKNPQRVQQAQATPQRVQQPQTRPHSVQQPQPGTTQPARRPQPRQGLRPPPQTRQSQVQPSKDLQQKRPRSPAPIARAPQQRRKKTIEQQVRAPTPFATAKKPPPTAAQQSPQLIESTDDFSVLKVVVYVGLVAAVSAFLGWILVGRPMANQMLRQEQLDQEVTMVQEEIPIAKKQPNKQATDPALVAPETDARAAVLSVKSNPPNAIVYLDDERFGVTPTQIRDLDPMGQYRLRIELAGHKTWEQEIVLDGKDLDREIVAGLIAQGGCSLGTGYLYITTKPRGATVEIDGKRLPGKTPKVVNDVCARVPLNVRLRAKGHRTWHQKIEIQEGEIKNLNVVLKKS